MLSQQQIAQLQAMDINLYQALQEQPVSELPWLNDLCRLLGISSNDCVYDTQTPNFDYAAKTLHLPKSISVEESAFKKAVWQQVRQWVD